MLMASRSRRVRREPHDLTDRELLGRVYRLAWCASSVLDPDDWFPVAQQAAKAQDQAGHAIAVCARCPVRPDCWELSLRYAPRPPTLTSPDGQLRGAGAPAELSPVPCAPVLPLAPP